MQNKNKDDLKDKKLHTSADEEHIHPPDTSIKKEGVTSSFSSATGDAGKYSGEDISDVNGSTGGDQDKVANRD